MFPIRPIDHSFPVPFSLVSFVFTCLSFSLPPTVPSDPSSSSCLPNFQPPLPYPYQCLTYCQCHKSLNITPPSSPFFLIISLFPSISAQQLGLPLLPHLFILLIQSFTLCFLYAKCQAFNYSLLIQNIIFLMIYNILRVIII